MKAARFDYKRASTLSKALEFLDSHNSDAKVMAGSQSFGPMLNLRLARPGSVIDISLLHDLKQVTREGALLKIGSGLTHAEIEDGVVDLLRGHPWQSVASSIAYRSVRNRGTLGGSLAHADPAADWVLASTVMNAEIEIASAKGIRRVPMNQFMLGAYTTTLTEQEIITAILIPAMNAQARWGYFKFCRKIGEFADASCAAYFDPSNKTANVAVGALDGVPRSLSVLAKSIAKDGWHSISRDIISEQVSLELPELDELDQKLYATVISRCLERAFKVEEQA